MLAGPVHLSDLWGVQHRGKSALCLKAVVVNERNDKFLMGFLLKSCVMGCLCACVCVGWLGGSGLCVLERVLCG